MGLTGYAWPSQPWTRSQRPKPYLSRPATTVREHLARQGDNELGKFIHLAFHRDRAAMLLRDDVVGDREAEAGARWLVTSVALA
jgi:hypothetical protein